MQKIIILAIIFVIILSLIIMKPKTISKNKAIELANKKAGELGYDIAKMDTEVTRLDDAWKIYYSPKGNVLGGDLEIRIDFNGNIKEVIRGQ